ncbi:NUAK family SNF1-like kinase [Nesidiocoris tenuis]|uniref:NUAK family SNF1-like kinase n=1 Tax=Nesidiocoris tenuis TaxID=355587 RepID=A0ABN7BDG1_9HEMI|nr:NUAK family SNF1-like kinase [Nesidiocoris tenuis]
MVVPDCIDNIMGGLESTGGVTLHNHRRKLKQRFDIIAKLGQGTYGKVQLGVNKETGQEVAIKIIKKCKIKTEADLIRIRREIQIMSSMKHPYIIHIYEVFENRDKMVLVMEYASGGELFDYLTKHKVLEESEARRIFRQIAMGIYYCHKHRICHRDLKLENILLDEHGNAKIADFGLTNVFDGERLLSTFCGSPLYASPEIVKGVPYYGPEVDCWSLGVLLYTLVYGAMPFDGSNFKRLVRQISAGDYFEPNNPSSASDLIRGLLTVDSKERFDITAVCRHPWMDEEGKVSCFRLAEQLAEEEPNRLDLLLALASPPQPQEAAGPEEGATSAAPVRSHSLGSFSTIQPSATFTTVPSKPVPEEVEPKKPTERKRERSSSRSRRKETDEEKARRRSVKSKSKASDSDLGPREEIEKVLAMAAKVSAEISPIESTPSSVSEESKSPTVLFPPSSTEEDSKIASETTPSDDAKPATAKEKNVKKEKKKDVKPRDEKSSSSSQSSSRGSVPASPVMEGKEKRKTVRKPSATSLETPSAQQSSAEVVSQERDAEQTPPAEKVQAPQEQNLATKQPSPKEASEPRESKGRPEVARRNSRVLETAELFSRSTSADRMGQKKLPFIAGVKVSDARAAFERRSSASQSPPSEQKPDSVLASTVNLNQLVMSELSKDQPPTPPSPEKPDMVAEKVPVVDSKETEDDRLKKEKAVKVISSAISEGGLGDKKSATLPKRRLSRPLPSVGSRDSVPKEVIIPIQIESREETRGTPQPAERVQPERPPPISSRKTSVSSRASSSSLGRQDSNSSTISVSTTITASEPIRKSPREVIIPIAVEGGGIVTPSESTLSKMSSASESLEDVPLRGFGLHSTRRRHPQPETADSISSDEDDGDFEAISTENLFTTLLARMRNLTQRLDEGRAPFPSLFNSSFEPRRLIETKSFDTDPPIPWRRKSGTMHSASSTLPRGFTTKSQRRYRLRDDEAKTDNPAVNLPKAPGPKRWITRTTSDFSHNLNNNPVTQPNDGPGRSANYHMSKSESVGPRGPNPEVSCQPNENMLPYTDRIRRFRNSEFFDEPSGLGYHRFFSQPLSNPVEYVSPVEPQGMYRYPSPSTSQDGSDFGRYIDFKRSLERDRVLPPGRLNSRSFTAYDKIRELHEYRRRVQEQWKAREESELAERQAADQRVNNFDECGNQAAADSRRFDNQEHPWEQKIENIPADDGSRSKDGNRDEPAKQETAEEKPEKPKKESRFLNKIRKNKMEESRVDRTIKALRKNSIGVEDAFSESKLLKRAVSMEDIDVESGAAGRSVRASSLKPEDSGDKVFKRKEAIKFKKGGVFSSISPTVDSENNMADSSKEAKKNSDETPPTNGTASRALKKLELSQNEFSAVDVSPTGDFDEANSQFSQTDNSDTWSSSDLTERYLDAGSSSCLLTPEENIGERIRRKSFYHRFNMPKRYAYQRSSSNMERKRYF